MGQQDCRVADLLTIDLVVFITGPPVEVSERALHGKFLTPNPDFKILFIIIVRTLLIGLEVIYNSTKNKISN